MAVIVSTILGNSLLDEMVQRTISSHNKTLGEGYDIDSNRRVEEEEGYYRRTWRLSSVWSERVLKQISKRRFLRGGDLNHLFVS